MDVDPKRGYIYISHIEGMWFQVKSTALGVRVPGVLDSLVPPTSCVTLGKLFNLFSLVPNFKMVMIFKVPHHLVFVMIKSVGVCKTPRLCGTCINHTMYGLCPHSHAWSVWISYVTWQKRLWCWEGLGAGGEGDDRGWDGWMTSLTLWAWVYANSRREGLACCDSWGRKESDTTEQLNWTSLWSNSHIHTWLLEKP